MSDIHRPVIITQNGEPRGVLQDLKSYEDMRYALGLIKLISQGEKDINEGKYSSQEDTFSRIRKAIGEK